MDGFAPQYDDQECRLWDAEELLWAAGLFEGEGCITISGKYARLKLNSTDEDVVRRFHRAIGFGQVRVEDAQIKHGYKRQWEWYMAAQAEVQLVLMELIPYLGARRRARAHEVLSHILNR